MSDPPTPRLRRAKHRRVRAGLALAARVAANECGQRANFNQEVLAPSDAALTSVARVETDLGRSECALCSTND